MELCSKISRTMNGRVAYCLGDFNRNVSRTNWCTCQSCSTSKESFLLLSTSYITFHFCAMKASDKVVVFKLTSVSSPKKGRVSYHTKFCIASWKTCLTNKFNFSLFAITYDGTMKTTEVQIKYYYCLIVRMYDLYFIFLLRSFFSSEETNNRCFGLQSFLDLNVLCNAIFFFSMFSSSAPDNILILISITILLFVVCRAPSFQHNVLRFKILKTAKAQY